MKHNFYLFLALIFILNTLKANTTKEAQPENTSLTNVQEQYSFTFKDLQNNSSLLTMKNDVYTFKNIQQSIVMVTLFSTWCPPCRGQIPHLTNLQRKFKKNLFILGALVHDDIEDKALQKFIISEKALFFISNNQEENLKFAKMIAPKLRLPEDFPMPLMILFKEGEYFSHYEGSMPEEMIESDIEQLLKKIKKKKD